MNAIEIEEAVSRLAEEPFDAESFPYAFLEAFGNKATTIGMNGNIGYTQTEHIGYTFMLILGFRR